MIISGFSGGAFEFELSAPPHFLPDAELAGLFFAPLIKLGNLDSCFGAWLLDPNPSMRLQHSVSNANDP